MGENGEEVEKEHRALQHSTAVLRGTITTSAPASSQAGTQRKASLRAGVFAMARCLWCVDWGLWSKGLGQSSPTIFLLLSLLNKPRSQHVHILTPSSPPPSYTYHRHFHHREDKPTLCFRSYNLYAVSQVETTDH